MRLVDVYPYHSVAGHTEFLILKRAPHKQYAGQWRMVGGKIQDSEKAWQAGLRELKEETSITPDVFWAIPSVNFFYNHREDRIEYIPTFAACVPAGSKIELDEEHTEYQWIESTEADNFVKWPEQRRLIQLTASILNDQILEDWIISF